MTAKDYHDKMIKLGKTEQDLKDNCFDYKKGGCDGRCQGCSDCPYARPFHDTSYKIPSLSKIRDYFYESSKSYIETMASMEKFFKTKKGKQQLKRMLDAVNKKIRSKK